MKKVYLLVSGLMLSAGAANAQAVAEGQSAPAKYATSFSNNNRVTTAYGEGDRDPDDIIWSNDFSDAGDWIADGPTADHAVSGWTTGSVTDSWWGGMAADMGTTGDFARFRNGNTTDFVEDGPFTYQYDGTIDLTGVPAPHLEFEQYGARFITLQAVEVSTDGGTTWVQVGNNDDIAPLTAGGGAAYGQPETRRFNITAAIAADPSNVSVRLFWDGALNGASTNYIDYGWYVDDIRIVEGHAYDSDIQASYFRTGVGSASHPLGMEYYKVPLSQTAPIDFAAETINQGGFTFTGLKLDVEVTEGGASVYTGTSTTVDLAAAAEDSLGTTDTFTPTAVGTYNVSWSFSGTEVDTYSPNDELTDAFEVTDYEYSRANDEVTGSTTNWADGSGNPFSIGNEMIIHNDAVIGGMYIQVTDNADNVGKLMYGQIMRLSADGSSYEYVSQTADHEITVAENGTAIFLMFEDAIDVAADDVLLVLAAHYGSDVEFAYAQKVEQGTVLGYNAASELLSLIDPEAFMITLDMRDFENIVEESSSFSVSQNMPNPFGNNAIINYELNNAANVSVEIVDVTGKVVNSIENGTQSAGSYTLELNAADYAEGVYYYTFTVGAERLTKRMVITK